MKFWPKLIAFVALVAVLSFVGVRLVQAIAGMVGSFYGSATVEGEDPQFAPVEPTATPLLLNDQDYDAVQGVREY